MRRILRLLGMTSPSGRKADRRPLGDHQDLAVRALALTGAAGVSVAVAQRDDGIVGFAAGAADLATGAPMQADSVVNAGSMSKMYTAVAVLQLVEQGIVHLHGAVREYLPELPIANPLGTRDVTVHDLLTFQSGLSRDTLDCTFEEPPPLADYLDRRLRSPATRDYGGRLPTWSHQVGAAFEYSNLGYAVLGHLVESVNEDHASFSNYVRERILTPLQMKSSCFPPAHTPRHVPAQLLSRRATGYAHFGPLYLPTPHIHASAWPAASLLTTAPDHARLLLALLNGGSLSAGRILAPESVEAILHPEVPLGFPASGDQSEWWYGLGSSVRRQRSGTAFFGHTGGYPWGWWNESRAYPGEEFAVVVCTNTLSPLSWFRQDLDTAASLVCDALAARLTSTTTRASSKRSTAAWLRGFIAGIFLAERTRGFLGIERPLDEDQIQETIDRAQTRSTHLGQSWDPDGFRAGIEAFHDQPASMPHLRQWVQAELPAIVGSDLPLLLRELGGDPKPTMPLNL
jgi:CubicO group peptidase (beta-lactamase class C family)